jgi:hypothetical protein
VVGLFGLSNDSEVKMEDYIVTAPDGKEYIVTAPKGATQDQVLAYAKENYTKTNQPKTEQRTIGQEISRQAGLASRALYEGFTAPATMALEGVKGAYNLAARALGSESRMPSVAEAQSRMLTEAGLPEPATFGERAAQAAMQGMVGAGAQGLLPRVVAGVETAPLTQNLAMQIPAAAVAGGVAQPAAEQTKKLTDSDLAAALVGFGAGALGAQIGGKAGAKLAAEPVPVVTIDEIRQRAGRAYTRVEDMGIVLNQNGADNLFKTISTNLNNANFLPENAAPVQSVLNRYARIVGRGNVSFNDVDQMRQLAGTLGNSSDANVRRLSRVMTTSIDNYLANLSPSNVTTGAGRTQEAVTTILEARKDWRNQARANELEQVLDTAEIKALDPKVSESEAIRRGFINLAANRNKMRLFNEDEQTAIRKVASGGALDSFLSLAARFNPERSTLVSTGTIVGAATTPEYAVPIAAGGFAADKLQAFLRQQAAQRAISGLLTGTTPPPAPSMVPRGLMTGAAAPFQMPELVVEETRLPQ